MHAQGVSMDGVGVSFQEARQAVVLQIPERRAINHEQFSDSACRRPPTPDRNIRR